MSREFAALALCTALMAFIAKVLRHHQIDLMETQQGGFDFKATSNPTRQST